MNALLWIFLGHYVADFVMQSRWMGRNKSSDMGAMIAHILTYSIVLGLFVLAIAHPVPVFLYIVCNGVLHFMTDYCSSKLSGQCWRYREVSIHDPVESEQWEHKFWCVIGADQLIHIACLVLTLPILAAP